MTEVSIEFLEWVHPRLGVTPVRVEGDKPLILRAKIMTDYEDDEFARIEREQAMGWRKQQVEKKKELDPYRNLVLEEVALQFDMMPALGDTAASFAAFVRGMKR